MRQLLLLFTLFLCSVFIHQAQAKQIAISPQTPEIDNDTLGLMPGDSLIILAGTYEYLLFRNFLGSENAYIKVINKGKVTINSVSNIYYKQGINIKNCKYFSLLGNGTEDYNFGIEIKETKIGSGIDIREGSSYIEIAYIEIHNTDFAGIIAKDDPDCAGNYLRGRFFMKHIYLHHNYIHHTKGEGVYVGITAFDGNLKTCNDTNIVLLPHTIINVEVAYNLFENCGREAIQLFSVTKGALVHHNKIYNYGQALEPNQSSAIIFGLGSSGNIFNNYINSGFGHGIYINGDSNVVVFNNVMKNVGMGLNTSINILACGIYADTRRLDGTDRTFTITNNSIIGTKNNAIKIVNNLTANTNILVANNLICAFGIGEIVFDNKDLQGIKSNQLLSTRIEGNLLFANEQQAGFNAPEIEDYSLKPSSKAINAGINLYVKNINTDYSHRNRIIDKVVDVGAFEFQFEIDSLFKNRKFYCKSIFYNEISNLDGNIIRHSPGDTFCLAGEGWNGLKISNFSGSVSMPVVFTTISEQVSFSNYYYALQLNNLQNIKLLGDSAANWSIHDISGNAISYENCDNLIIENFIFENISNSAIQNILQDKGSDIGVYNTTFSNVEGKNCLYFNYANIEETDSSNKIIISNCFFNEINVNAIGVNGFKGKIEIYKNQFNDIGKQSVEMRNCGVSKIYANRIVANEEHGISLQNSKALIFSNIFTSALGENSFINIHDSISSQSSKAQTTYILQNTCIMYNGGFLLNNSSALTTKRLIIKNNILFGKQKGEMLLGKFNEMLDSSGNYLCVENTSVFRDFYNERFGLNEEGFLMGKGVNYNINFGLKDFNLFTYNGLPFVGAISPKSSVQEFTPLEMIFKHTNIQNMPNEDIGIYPNPAHDFLTLAVDKSIAYFQVELVNTNGKTLLLKECKNGEILDLSSIASGIYLVKIKTVNYIFYKNIIIEH